ncbi:MAG: AAA family ATPase [Candidatus Aenigmarchaeota archaeon]|nr:AAA family ATPase [Candidatus Aenigmarchaeota archaeon]
MITKLKLKNWKSHLDSDFDFTKGVNGLMGIMGAGKSIPSNEIILVKKNGVWKKCEIGELIENEIKKSKNVTNSNGSFFLTNTKNIEAQTLNCENLKMEKRKIKGFIKHTSPRKLLEITTRSGRRITITKDHSMLSFKNGAIVPFKGSDLRLGDFIPCVKKMNLKTNKKSINLYKTLPEFRETTNIIEGLKLVKDNLSPYKASKITGITESTFEYWRQKNNLPMSNHIIGKTIKTAISKNINFSDNFTKLAGAYLSEGHVQYNLEKYRYGVKITNNDINFIETVKKCWIDVFPYIPYNYIQNDLQMNGKVVSALFSRLFGKKSGNKKIPDFLYGVDNKLISNLLMMYFEGDGWVVADRELACSSKSLKLIDGLSTLFSKFGIITTIRERKIKDNSYYNLKILPKHANDFAKNINFLTERKKKKLDTFVNMINNRKSWDGIDVIPNIDGLLQKLIYEYHLYSKKIPEMRSLAMQFRIYMRYETIGREKLKRSLKIIFERFGFKTKTFRLLEKIIESDIFFDKIKEIKEIDAPSKYVYDLSVEDTENFVAGIGNLITHNSSIVQGISFALFGTFPGLQARKLILDDLIMRKPNKKNFAQIELEFIVNGDTYNVLREIVIGKGTTKTDLRKNGSMIEVSPKAVTKVIEDLLQMDYELFSKAVYSEQNGIDYFLRIPRGHRMEHIDKMLKVDRFEKAREQTVSVKNKLKISIEEKLRFISEMEKEGLGEKIKEEEKEITRLENKSNDLQKNMLKLKEITEKLVSNISAYETNENKLNEMKIEVKGLTSGISEIEKNLNGASGDSESVSKEIEISERIMSRITNSLDNKTRHVEKIRDKIASMNTEMKIIDESILELERVKGKCPVCETEITENKRDKIASDRLKEQEKLREGVKNFVAELDDADKEKESLEEKLKENETKRQKMINLLDEMNKIEELRKRKEEYKKRSDFLKSKISSLENKSKKVDINSLKEELHEKKKLEGSISTELDSLTERLKEKDNTLRDLKEREGKLKDYKKEAEIDEKLIGALISFENVLKITQDQLRDEFLKTVNQIMNSVWNELYPYDDFPEIRLFIEGDYILQLRASDGNWLSVEGIVSGGERSMAALALRIAFSLAFIPNLKWLILDEPTHNLDSAAIDRFSEVLGEKMESFAEQVFLITHEERLSEGITGKLYRLERDKESDGVTIFK